MSAATGPYQDILKKYADSKNKVEILPLSPPRPPLVIEETPILPTNGPLPANLAASLTPELKAPEPLIEKPNPTIKQPITEPATSTGNIFKITTIVTFVVMLVFLALNLSALYQKQNVKNSLDALPRITPTIPAPSPAPTCLAGDKTYAVYEIFEAADGSSCSCKPNLNIDCGKPQPTTKASTPSAQKSPVCSYAGKQYQVGESYKQDCNTCLCLEDGLPSCTKVACKK